MTKGLLVEAPFVGNTNEKWCETAMVQGNNGVIDLRNPWLAAPFAKNILVEGNMGSDVIRQDDA